MDRPDGPGTDGGGADRRDSEWPNVGGPGVNRPDVNQPGVSRTGSDEDEIRVFADGRPAVPPYRAEARARARERLLGEAGQRHGTFRFRLPRLGLQAAAAFGVTVVLVGGVAVALSNQGAGGVDPAAPVTQSAVVSSETPSGELSPRPGQFILVESSTMYGMFSMGQKGEVESRQLYRTNRKIWQSVDGSANGLLFIEELASKPWPGQSLPDQAERGEPGSTWHTLASCPAQLGEARLDYAFLSTLPADATAMRERLYRLSGGPHIEAKGIDADEAAFNQVGDMVRETYLPRAQRDALFEAAKSIPGVEVAEGVADGSDRKGVALALPARGGTLRQFIFDPETHLYLGERSTVVDAKAAVAPKGSVVGLSAQTKVSVVDELPEVTVSTKGDAACATPEPLPSDAPAAEPAVTPPSEFPSGAPTGSPQVTAPAEQPVPLPTGSPQVTAPAEQPPVDGVAKTPEAAPTTVQPTSSTAPEAAPAGG
ncbi:hypothetical protein GCM10022419_008530 [Nonomuraea rosea]|uniref:CU044_5270 family protein n=1 Tax=Nonomuraea rosea TaxID=638574 RepID=A0ABP6VAI3_9ACTN